LHKWRTYTKKYFLLKFLIFLVFILLVLLDIGFGSSNYGLPVKKRHAAFISLRTLSQLILSYFLYFEFLQINRFGLKDYLVDLWNLNDIILQIVYPVYLILSFTIHDHYTLKSFQCAIIFLSFIKVGFLVQLLMNVFIDLRYFMLFFTIVVSSFGIYLGICVKGLDSYDGIGPVGYFAIALRTSIGDYDFGSFSQNSDYEILTWLVWLLVMIVGNVVFMNFIIAVVS
jgi:hypothetical protein